MDKDMLELKEEALKVIMEYVDGNPNVSDAMCRTATRVLAACSDESAQ